MILKSMELINPKNHKKWYIEVEGDSAQNENAIIRTCYNGKVNEKNFQGSEYQINNKFIQAMMAKLRKGYVYRNSQAKEWEACFHGYVDGTYTGFMPIASNQSKDDFYLIRVKKDFEDELIYHYSQNGELLDCSSLGAKRLTYRACLNNDGSVTLQSDNLEIYFPDKNEITVQDNGTVIRELYQTDTLHHLKVNYIGYNYPALRGYFDIINSDTRKLTKRIFNEFTIKNAFCAFTSNRLIVHTDYGVLSIYKISEK